MSSISSYYDLAKMGNDDVLVVCILLQLKKIKMDKKLLNRLETITTTDTDIINQCDDILCSFSKQSLQQLASYIQSNITNKHNTSDDDVLVLDKSNTINLFSECE